MARTREQHARWERERRARRKAERLEAEAQGEDVAERKGLLTGLFGGGGSDEDAAPELDGEAAAPKAPRGRPKGTWTAPKTGLADLEARLTADLEHAGTQMVIYTPLKVTGLTIATQADLGVKGVVALATNHKAVYNALRRSSDVEAIIYLGAFLSGIVYAARVDLSGVEPTGIVAERTGVRANWLEIQRAVREGEIGGRQGAGAAPTDGGPVAAVAVGSAPPL